MRKHKDKAPGRPAVRWWPAIALILADGLFLVWLWFFYDQMRQLQVILTLVVQSVVVLLLLIWLLFFSRLAGKHKFSVIAVAALAVVLFLSLFRFKELSGDLAPIFTWRWQSQEVNSMTPEGPATRPPPDHVASENIRDYPQFLGPGRNAKIATIALEPDWQRYPPTLIWRRPIGQGWSAFSVAGHLALTQEQRDDAELVSCYELLSGKMVWQHSEPARHQTALGGVGPRATPTIVGDRVYTLGATGNLNCLKLATGEVMWHSNIQEVFRANAPNWGYSGSPLVFGDTLVVCAGGSDGRSLIAYHKDTGSSLWSAGDDRAGYSSPMLTSLAGTRQILIFTENNVVAHAPGNGAILWRFPWQYETQKVAQPLVLPNDRVLISTGYGIGCKLLAVKRAPDGGLTTALLWENNRLKAKFANMIYHDGYVYGLDDGILVCLDPEDGTRKWKRGRYGHGQILLVDELLLVTTERGEVVLVAADPAAFREIARIEAISGKTWNNPALAGKYLLVRNGEEAACYELVLDDGKRSIAATD
jgi:outer membrane protein assembly factor BamB